MSPTAEIEQLDNPYRASQYAVVEDAPAFADDPEVAELQIFVGRKANYYLRKWARRLESPDGDVGMNWAAFFLTAIWMAYRRMHLNAAFCLGAAFGVSLAVEVLFRFVFKSPAVPVSVNLLVNLMFALVCGAFGNAWYLAHAKRKIAALKAQGLDGDHLYYAISQRGGTSWLAVFGWLFGPGLVILFLALIAGVVIAIAVAAR